MANTRATCTGHRSSSDTGTASRLGSTGASADVATWRLRCACYIDKDGGGYTDLRAINGGTIARMTWEQGEDGKVALTLHCTGHDAHHYTAEA